MTVPVILASGSETRAKLLQDAGLDFGVNPARIDEAAICDSLRAEGHPPRSIADALAEAKALKVSNRHPGARIIGSDQILALNGGIYSKARTREGAAETLRNLSGQTHELHSAAVIVEDGKPVWRAIETVKLTMHPLTGDQIEAYLDLTWPDVSGCVGCYQIEAQGIRLFQSIDGPYHAILGMPLFPLLSYLRMRGNLPS